jgi:hypothetical protein
MITNLFAKDHYFQFIIFLALKGQTLGTHHEVGVQRHDIELAPKSFNPFKVYLFIELLNLKLCHIDRNWKNS